MITRLKDGKYNIAIFDTFKTRKNKFTGEAKRQRGIISHLATEQSPELRTRTSIAHVIAKKHGILWQNIYSGIFRDLDEVLIPALQLEGVPFYELTEAGLLVASSIDELGEKRMKILESYITSIPIKDQDDKIIYDGLLLLIRMTPSLVIKIINEYILAYSTGVIDSITPMDITKLRSVVPNHIAVEKELIEAFILLQPNQKDLITNFFRVIS